MTRDTLTLTMLGVATAAGCASLCSGVGPRSILKLDANKNYVNPVDTRGALLPSYMDCLLINHCCIDTRHTPKYYLPAAAQSAAAGALGPPNEPAADHARTRRVWTLMTTMAGASNLGPPWFGQETEQAVRTP